MPVVKSFVNRTTRPQCCGPEHCSKMTVSRCLHSAIPSCQSSLRNEPSVLGVIANREPKLVYIDARVPADSEPVRRWR